MSKTFVVIKPTRGTSALLFIALCMYSFSMSILIQGCDGDPDHECSFSKLESGASQ